MIITMEKNGLDPRLWAYFEKRTENNSMGEDILNALVEVFEHVVLPPGELLPNEKLASLGWAEIEKKTLDAHNGMWKPIMRLDFYLFLYKKTDKEIAEIKRETGLILSSYLTA